MVKKISYEDYINRERRFPNYGIGIGAGIYHGHNVNSLVAKGKVDFSYPIGENSRLGGNINSIAGTEVLGFGTELEYKYEIDSKLSINTNLGANYNKLLQKKNVEYVPKEDILNQFSEGCISNPYKKIKNPNESETTIFTGVGTNYKPTEKVQLFGDLNIGCKLIEPSKGANNKEKESMKAAFSGNINLGATYDIGQDFEVGIEGQIPLSKQSDAYIGATLKLKF